jgi:hypothetical protein
MQTYLDAKLFDKDLLDAEVFDVDTRCEHIPPRVRHPEVDRGVQFDLGPMLLFKKHCFCQNSYLVLCIKTIGFCRKSWS